MKAERWQQVKALLDEALDVEEDGREALFAERCADDPALREEVETLLAADEEARSFLEATTTAAAADSGVFRRGAQIGPYRILRLIGEGGMGEVYEAEQAKPIRRKVALKFVKLGMDTKQVLARFDAERQALALMSHPSIARVFDVGTTEKGRPFFVMEYVPGVSVTEYCDTNHLGAVERLELLVRICEGVHHAHQKGIIHRDIKPSNVLVTLVDGEPVPKIIDFGVAKATAHRLTEATFCTELGQAVGTPEYMSPEQTEVTGIDVDTRTDVYALGILLYELLTGARPFDFREKGLSFDEMRRRIREEEPTRPSSRVRELSQTSPEVASNRHTDPGTLVGALRGDIDWITLKALEKDRARRYASVPELAADIRRHLSHRPVVAGPSSVSYRVGKFVRRHRIGVVAGSLVLGLLVAFAAAMTVQSVRISRERDRANREAETARQLSDFLLGLFSVSDPAGVRGNTITAREILDRGALSVERDLADQPLIQARLQDTIGHAYQSMGLYAEAEASAQEALGTRERTLGSGHDDVAASLQTLGDIYRNQGRYAEAEDLLRRALAIRESRLEENDPRIADTLGLLAIPVALQGRLGRAEAILERAVAIRDESLGARHNATLRSVHDLAAVHARQGKLDEAEPLFRRLLEDATPGGGLRANAALSLAIILRMRSDFGEAERLLEVALGIMERRAGPEHPDVANARYELARLQHSQGRYEEAEEIYRQSLDTRERALGAEHIQVAESLEGLARLCDELGRDAEAEEYYRRTLDIREKALGADHPSVVAALEAYTGLLRRTGREEEAATLLARSEGGRE